MYSVVIPTMWKNMRIVELIEGFNDCELVDEILLVDNNPDKTIDFPYYEKVNVIHRGDNMYVNPSWNLGVATAKNKKVIISNDDISFDVSSVLEYMKDKEYGCCGVHPIGINSEDKWPIEMVNNVFIGQGWGVLIFVDKDLYVDIPSGLKIWFGDNWISEVCKPSTSLLFNLYTEMSSSSNSNELKDVIRADISEWIRLVNQSKGGDSVTLQGEGEKA